jgi:hypothetical protein
MLVIPAKITIQLKNKDGDNLNLENVLIEIITKAAHKNDINLSPFNSNKDGRFVITKEDLQKEAENVYWSGIMDYMDITTAYPAIEIKIIAQESISKRIEFYTKVLDNSGNNIQSLKDKVSEERFQEFVKESEDIRKKLKETLAMYETSYNKSHQIEYKPIYDKWDKEQVVTYSLIMDNV